VSAKATAQQATQNVRAHMEEVGSRPNQDPGLQMISSRGRSSTAKTVANVFNVYGLSYRVPISTIDLGTTKAFPYLKFSDWVKQLDINNKLFECLPGINDLELMSAVLREFWERYEQIYPDHQIFERARAGLIDLSLCIPVYNHKDEGRSLKKLPIMIVHTQGVLGKGTTKQSVSKRRVCKHTLKRSGLNMNFIGHTYTTRFLFMAMHRKVYKTDPAAFLDMLTVYSKDLRDLSTEGVQLKSGMTLWVANIGAKGDWPIHVKAAMLTRSFQNVPKRGSSKKPCGGICHLDLAGLEDFGDPNKSIPFEDFNDCPAWMDSYNTVMPWATEPPELIMLHDVSDKPSFYKPDIWHNFHLGGGKHWIGSCCVLVLPFMPGTSVETRFQHLTKDFLIFCKQKKLSPVVKEVSRDTMKFLVETDSPCANWHKGSATTDFMLWFEDFCDRYICGKTADPALIAIVV
jgi:hypothetical protein